MDDPLTNLAAPARRALEALGISTLHDLARLSRADLTALHGVGNRTLVDIDLALDEAGVRLADEGDHELIFVEEWDSDWRSLSWAPVMALRTGTSTFCLPDFPRVKSRGERWHFQPGWEVRVVAGANDFRAAALHVAEVVLQPLTLRVTVSRRGVTNVYVTSDEEPRTSSRPDRDETWHMWLTRVVADIAAEVSELPRFPPRCPISECADESDRRRARARFTVRDERVREVRDRVMRLDEGLPIRWIDET